MTPRFGYHCSHEQHPPARLLEYARAAEAAGFDGAMCSDHFTPGWRYHPAIPAQAAATLAAMYPDRFWLAVGSGEALNEGITGERWPPRGERNARLAECLARQAEWLRAYAEVGVEAVYLFNVNRNQPEFIEAFGERVLPELR